MKMIALEQKHIEEMRNALFDQIVKELSPELLAKQVNDSLAKARLTDGVFRFCKDFRFERKFDDYKTKERAKLRITPEAFSKILLTVSTETKEVGWHCVTERVSDTEFVIKDILIYPQKVTGVTVETDDEEYTKWLIKIGEDNFANLKGHCHSHVNMGVSPSDVDMRHREKITAQLSKDDYYIFMIWNKNVQWSASIYNMPTNTQFETQDIDLFVEYSNGETAGDLIKDLNEKVKSSYVAPVAPATAPYSYQSYDYKKDKKKEKGGSASGNGRGNFQEERGGGYGGYGFGYQYPYYD